MIDLIVTLMTQRGHVLVAGFDPAAFAVHQLIRVCGHYGAILRPAGLTWDGAAELEDALVAHIFKLGPQSAPLVPV